MDTQASPQTQIPIPSRRGRGRARTGRAAALAALLAGASLATATTALATPALPALAKQAVTQAGVPGASGTASPYGEVSRFGGFAEGAVPGKFDQPVGFAVEPQDPVTHEQNDVYVLDRVVNQFATETTPGKLGYRLQKLSSTGTVLGSVTLPVQESEGTHTVVNVNPLISLAVDPAAHRVYALVQGTINAGQAIYAPVAQRLVAWSTQPNGAKTLVAAPGYSIDPLTGAGLVAGPSVLQPSANNEVLDAPDGLTVDPSTHDVVIEAQQGVETELGKAYGGPTILQRVATEGEEVGTGKPGRLDGNWVAEEAIAPEGNQADGLFTSSNGSFGVDLYSELGDISKLAEVSSDFSSPSAVPLAPDSSEGIDRDQAASIDNRSTVNNNSGFGQQSGNSVLLPYGAGSPVTQLSNGLYAARFGQAGAGATDPQSLVEPWDGVPYFWTQDNQDNEGAANEGIRLFNSQGTIIDTIGGQAQGSACNLDTEQLSVAAGADGSVFVLTQPTASGGGDQVIELAAGAGGCPQPSGSLTVNGQSGTSFSFPVGTEVSLQDTVDREGATPFRFDWVLLSLSNLSLEDLTNQITGPDYLWPAPSTTHTFTKPGTYYVAATMYGDYGLTYIGAAEIKIH